MYVAKIFVFKPNMTTFCFPYTYSLKCIPMSKKITTARKSLPCEIWLQIFLKRNFHLFKYIYRCIKYNWKEMLFLEEMTAVQVRLKCLWKAALASALQFVLSTIYIQAGKMEGWISSWVSEAEKRKKQKRMLFCFK